MNKLEVSDTPSSLMEKAIREAIETEVNKFREQLIQETVKQFEQDLRKRVGGVVLRLLDFYSVEMLHNEILIHVKIEKEAQL